MNDRVIVDYWMEKARDDLASARDNHASGRYQNAVRDAHFACFHVFSSVHVEEGKRFRKHKKVDLVVLHAFGQHGWKTDERKVHPRLDEPKTEQPLYVVVLRTFMVLFP